MTAGSTVVGVFFALGLPAHGLFFFSLARAQC
jgi:hypothetical protein